MASPMDQRDRDHARHLAKTSKDIAVFAILNAGKCDRCAEPVAAGEMLTHQDNQSLCLKCAQLEDLVLLPAGDPALTRRASKLSARRAVVLRWSRAGKRYERRGTLVEQKAIDAAREQCATDAETRARKAAKSAVKREAEERLYQQAFLAELKRLFPGCPEAEAVEIAQHACEKHSGRVGRSAAAKELDEEKIRLAVIAHIRHVHTGYDGFFTIRVKKQDARRMVQAKIEKVARQWQEPTPSGANSQSGPAGRSLG